MTSPKRKYTRLSSIEWAQVRGYWESGDHSLPELSAQYGVSARAIQTHLSKHGSAKGSKAAEMAAVVQSEIFKEELGDKGSLLRRARETREATYANAKIIEELVMAQLQIAQKDPNQAFKAATALKALSLAASALERLHATKSRALGLDRENALTDELPVLTIRDLTSAEIEVLRAENGDDEGGLDGPPARTSSEDLDLPDCEFDGGAHSVDESDAVVEEGMNDEAEDAALLVLGGRLVRGRSS